MILAVSTTLTNVLLIIGAILTVLGFVSYLYIVIATKKNSPEELVRKFKKGKPVHNASAVVDLWGAITLGVAIIGLMAILAAVIVATKA